MQKKLPIVIIFIASILLIFTLFVLLYQTQKMDIIYLMDDKKEIKSYNSQDLKTEIIELPILCRQILPNGDYIDTPLTLTQKLKNGSNFNDYSVSVPLPYLTEKNSSCLNFERLQRFIDTESNNNAT